MAEVISALVLSGDLSKLTPDQKVLYYTTMCERVGLDPTTQPFGILKLNGKEMDERLKNGPELVSAKFVIPYPPGFPIMVPGQVITNETIVFMRKLDVKEIHGYHAAHGLKLLKPAVLAGRKKAGADI